MRLLKTALAFTVLGVVGSAFAADNFQAARSGLPHDAIYSLDRSGNSLWAIGGHGLVLRSDVNGREWERFASPGDFAALGMAIHDGQPVLVGQAGKAFQLSNDGEGWEPLDSGTEERLLDIVTLSNGSQLAVGSFGTIVKRSPGSDSFTKVAVDWDAIIEDGFEPHLYDVMQTKAGTILIAAEFGMVLRSRNGGKTWSVQNTNDSSVFALHQGRNGLLVGVGQAGYIISSKDDGVSWQASKSGTSANLLGVSSSGKTFAVVGVRAVLKSDNGGRSWKAVSNRETERRWYQGITGVSPDSDGRKFVAAGQFGQIVNF
jgi:photosystem II stability/assembly factor-like uncharacterized protein